MRKLIALWFGSGEPNDPEETRIVEIVRDLSGDDAAAMATARTVIRDGLPADSDYAHVYGSARTYALVAHSLARHRWLIALDWKEEWEESIAWFSDLFEAAGIDSGHPLRPFRRRDGDVQDALAGYTVLAEQAGLRIVQLVTDSDMYEFALTTPEGPIAGREQRSATTHALNAPSRTVRCRCREASTPTSRQTIH